MFFRARQFDEAMAQCRDALELEPANGTLHRNLATLYVQKGMYDEAITEISRTDPASESVTLTALLARAQIGKGQREKAMEAAKHLRKQAAKQPGAWFHLATVYVDLGEKDEALGCLQKAYEFRDDRLVWLKADPRFDNVSTDPRYRDLLARMGLKP